MVLTHDGHRRQYEPLDGSDLTAAWHVLNALSNESKDYVVFYNCGRDGGCSRLHKHMQLVPTPPGSFASFLDAGITSLDSASEAQPGGTTASPESSKDEPEVPFHWFHHRFGESCQDNQHSATTPRNITPTDLAKIYADLLAQAAAVTKGETEHDDTSLPGAAACPHNLVFTRRWMLVIPRRRGAVQKTIAANAIGMLGVIPVASREEMDDWVKLGPANALRELGVPR